MSRTYIFGFIISLFLFTDLSAQKQDTMQTYRYGIQLGVDVSGYLYKGIYDKNFEGVGFYLNARIYRDYFFDVIFGKEQYEIKDVDRYPFFRSKTSGEYLKVGFSENILDFDLGIHGTMFYGLRYGYARYTQTLVSQGGYYTKYWDDLFGTILSKQTDSYLETHILEASFGTQVDLIYGLNVSFQVRGSAILSESNAFKILEVPGHGENRNLVSLGFYYIISYEIPMFKVAHRKPKISL